MWWRQSGDLSHHVERAKREHPEAVIWIKIHPDVLAGKKQGHFTEVMPALARDPQIRFLAGEYSSPYLIEEDGLYLCRHLQMGFEALMLGKKVVIFGLPWYAGWD
ncbi:capsular polysaccharide export protein, LipB/KpsS family [Ignatzschineria indica]|uniref:capsular polysaccharide export protein, LipB/KpsS family n=1 Tax=Ignatzschineria indica TaxID=472583 RepID=UPI00362DD6E0